MPDLDSDYSSLKPDSPAATGANDGGRRVRVGEEEPDSGKMKEESPRRCEIDTSAPFESVKEAATRFGGIGFWKPSSHKSFDSSQKWQHDLKAFDITKVEEQALQLEKDLIAKEMETLDVLKELEKTKVIVEDLKQKLQKEASEANPSPTTNSEPTDINHGFQITGKENCGIFCPSSAPGFILMELKQAKLNLTRNTHDLADIRATVESFNRRIEKERISLEKTRERLSFSSSKVSSLEEELNQTRQKLKRLTKDGETGDDSEQFSDISRELRRLSSEADQYKKVGDAAKSEVLRATSEIEQIKTRIRTAETKLVAAKKMKEAARATEAVALAEIKALSRSDILSDDVVTLSLEEYSSLISKSRNSEKALKRKVTDAMVLVDEANLSKSEILKKVEEATEEVKNSKKVLEEAMNRVDSAHRAKLSVEEALRKWRSENGQKRRSIQNSTKFKNSCPSHRMKDTSLLNVNGPNLMKPNPSIGQILSRKLLLTEDFENGGMKKAENGALKRKVSLGQMLTRRNDGTTLSSSTRKADKENGCNKQQLLPVKRKKFGFAGFSVLATKQKQNQSKKKKHQAPNPWCHSGF